MRCFALVVLAWSLAACSQPPRDNPLDPGGTNTGPGLPIQLTAQLPLASENVGGIGARLVVFRFEVTAADMQEPIGGEMSLVGTRARAQISGITDGADRVFRVDVFDDNDIRTFTATDTVDVDAARGEPPGGVVLQLQRLQGTLELSSELPPEVVILEVVIDADGDTILHVFDEVEGMINERIDDVPTGTDVVVLLRGLDSATQILIETQVVADVRSELVSHINVPLETGVLNVTANFPPYIPIVAIDRFSDAAATFFRRSDDPSLPGAGEAIDFDDERFLLKGVGPNREQVTFYHFDVRNQVPAPVYFFFDRRDDLITTQLPVFDVLPGEEGYNDFWQVFQVRVLESDYLANSLTSLQDILDGGHEIVSTEEVINAVMVPPGSRASRRFDVATPNALHNGWYQGQIVKYLLFENASSTAQVDFGGERINTPLMYGFFENDRNETEGFAIDSATQATHNVFSSLPGLEGYAPLWAVQIFRLAVFDRVQDVASALEETGIEENLIIVPNLFVNAPIVEIQ